MEGSNVKHSDAGLMLTLSFTPEELQEMLDNAKAGGAVELVVRLDVATALTIKDKEIRLR